MAAAMLAPGSVTTVSKPRLFFLRFIFLSVRLCRISHVFLFAFAGLFWMLVDDPCFHSLEGPTNKSVRSFYIYIYIYTHIYIYIIKNVLHASPAAPVPYYFEF